MQGAILKRNGFKLGIGVIAAAALYRPMVMWAENAWDVSEPQKLFLIGLVLFAVGMILYLLLIVPFDIGPELAAIAIAGSLYISVNWGQLHPHPLVWITVLALFVFGAHLLLNADRLTWVLLVLLAVLGLAPAFQVVIAHVQKSQPFPIVDLAPRDSVTATGSVEDVLVVIVDSYPSLAIAESWFAHDTSAVHEHLSRLGYTVESVAWSQHSFTALAVPSLLELQPVATAGRKGAWGNRRSTYEIMRGNSLVAKSFKSAGFRYLHVESGWDGSSCGEVDVCLESVWLDEAVWSFLRPSAIGDLLVERYGHYQVGATLQVVENLEKISGIFDDGKHDYVFAHLLLPHPPLVVDETCEVWMDYQPRAADFDPQIQDRKARDMLDAQLSCADHLIGAIAEVAGARTATIITGDHGTGTGDQVGRPPATWSDADIAERLGIFLAYRLPEDCAAPVTSVSTDVMRAAVSCALDIEMPARNGSFLIGADEPMAVDDNRMREIDAMVRAGSLSPDPDD